MAIIIEDELRNMAPSFSQVLFTFIDTKGMKDVEVYKRARIDRRLFSKLRKNNYVPKKATIIAIALALRLSYDETIDLLSIAGYTLSTSRALPFDVIVANSINKGIYDIDIINEKLHMYGLPILGE